MLPFPKHGPVVRTGWEDSDSVLDYNFFYQSFNLLFSVREGGQVVDVHEGNLGTDIIPEAVEFFRFFSASILMAPAGHLYFARPAEVFVIYKKTAVIAGFILASPVVFFQFWRFILPAMMDRERTWTVLFVPLSVALFLGGIGFSYFLVMPQSLHFLMAFGGENFTPLLSMESYLEFVLLMILPFGVMFNLPLLMMALALAGLVKEKTLKEEESLSFWPPSSWRR